MDGINFISVCFVSIDIYPLFSQGCIGIQGGSEVDFYMIATELAKDKRFRVSIITGDFGQPDVETIDNITIFKASDIQLKPFIGTLALWKAMRRADADIYFKKGAAFTTDLVALFCRLNNKKFFFRTGTDYECNGLYFQEHPFKAKTYLWSLRSASRVFVQKVSDVPRFLQTTGVTPIAIPNGHRIDKFKHHNQLRDSILWVGRTDVLKQPNLFIELARQVPSEHFVMICQKAKDDTHYDELIQNAASVGNLKFIKSVPFAAIDRYFEQAKILVNTSSAEGFPNTFIQAGKCAVPILSLAVNPDGFLDKFNCGICCGGDMNKMATSLKYMLSGDKYITIGINARKYVEENHDIAKIIDTYKKHFVNAIS